MDIQIIALVVYGILTLMLIGIGATIIKLTRKKISVAAGIAMLLIFIVVMLTVASPYFIMYRGIYSGGDKVVGEYTEFGCMMSYWADEEWKIGANKYGEPIFENPEEAFLLADQKFADILDMIQEEYDLEDFSAKTFKQYKEDLYHVDATGEALRQRSGLHEFMDIYENSCKRWRWFAAEGWTRDYV